MTEEARVRKLEKELAKYKEWLKMWQEDGERYEEAFQRQDEEIEEMKNRISELFASYNRTGQRFPIIEVRKAYGVSRKQVCTDLGIPMTNLVQWESGKNKIPAEAGQRLCDYYHISMDYVDWSYGGAYIENLKSQYKLSDGGTNNGGKP